jgi:hypothetical protein
LSDTTGGGDGTFHPFRVDLCGGPYAITMLATGREFLMSEKLLRFFLEELETVRLVCTGANCKGVIELPTKELMASRGGYSCPCCRAPFNTLISEVKSTEPLVMLANAIAALETQSARFRVQFVLKEND